MSDGGADFRAISSKGEEEVLWLRTSILESIGHLEGLLDRVLARYLTSTQVASEILEKQLLPRVSLSIRLSTLVGILDDRIDDFPFFAFLPKAIDHRNILAHMSLDIFESSDKWLIFTGWREGQQTVKKIHIIDLRRSDASIYHSNIDLRLIYDDVFARQARQQAIANVAERYRRDSTDQ